MKRSLPVLLAFVLAACMACGCGTGKSALPVKETYKPSFHAPAAQDGLVFQDRELQFQMLRAMGASSYGAADIGECLVTAMQIDEAQINQGDFDTWYDAWNAIAERLRATADGSLADGDEVSARDGYLRCNTYYNMAEFYLHGNPSDPRIAEASGKAGECFRKAGALMEPPVEEVKIRYEDTTIPGYFYRVDTSGKKRPLLIVQTGFDGTQEELYAGAVVAGLERGYNVMTFEGPGQGRVVRTMGLYFRPDWQKVVTPVIDYAVSRGDVDSGKIALWGISMGGCLAARAAAYEPRIKALILDPAMDMAQVVLRNFGPMIQEITKDPDFKLTARSLAGFIEKNTGMMDEMFGYAMKSSISANWFVSNGMYTFGVKRPSDFPLKMLEYSMDEIAPRIKCHTLVCDSEQDVEKYGSMTRDIYDALICPKRYVLFTNAEGAGAHCQIGAARFGCQVKLDWLNENVGNRR